MTPERNERTRVLFRAALNTPPEKRSSFLAGQCADAKEREEVETLLLEHERAAGDRESPPTVVLGRHERLLSGRYRIVRELGQGGFGAVYLARDEQLEDRAVVVKTLLEENRNDPWLEKRFAEEVRALARIDHPGVVGVLDQGKSPDGVPFVVMQYVEGETLRAVLSRGGIALARAAEIVRQAASALSAAHDKKVWHLDLKPENIMLQRRPGGEEFVKLIDFGIARVRGDGDTTLLTLTRIVGTLAYMAPEQLEGKPSEASDIYALGIIAYELLTGQRPFAAKSLSELISAQESERLVRPRNLNALIPDEAERVILRALRYRKEDRFAGAREFGQALADALARPAAPMQAAVPEEPDSGAGGGATKRRWMWMTGAAVSAAILAGGWLERGWLTSESRGRLRPRVGSGAAAQTTAAETPPQPVRALEQKTKPDEPAPPGILYDAITDAPPSNVVGLTEPGSAQSIAPPPDTPAAAVAGAAASAASATPAPGSVAPSSPAAAGPWHPPPAAARRWKDRAEYDLYFAVTKETDPNARLALLRQWDTQYPASDFILERLQLELSAYSWIGKFQEAFDAAKSILADDPRNFSGLYYSMLYAPMVTRSNAAPEALAQGEQACNAFLDLIARRGTPENMTEKDWKAVRPPVEAVAHRTLGWVALKRRNWTLAEAEIRKALGILGADGFADYLMGSALAGSRDPQQVSAALFYFARAAAYDGPGSLSADGRKQALDYVSAQYQKLHGSAEGFDALLETARAQVFPPAGFQLKSAAELAAAQNAGNNLPAAAKSPAQK